MNRGPPPTVSSVDPACKTVPVWTFFVFDTANSNDTDQRLRSIIVTPRGFFVAVFCEKQRGVFSTDTRNRRRLGESLLWETRRTFKRHVPDELSDIVVLLFDVFHSSTGARRRRVHFVGEPGAGPCAVGRPRRYARTHRDNIRILCCCVRRTT